MLARYADGHLGGLAAVTRRTVGAGAAYYVSTVPDPATWRALAARVLTDAAVETLPVPVGDVELVRRRVRPPPGCS